MIESLVRAFGVKAAKWWLKNRPLSKENRAIRKERRRLRRKNRERRKLGLPLLELPKEPLMETGFRTSTVASVVGVVVLVVMKVLEGFFPDFVAAVPGLGETLAAAAAYFAARANKDPVEPGVL